MNKTKHHLVGKTVNIVKGTYKGCDYKIEGYWDEIDETSWQYTVGNPACLKYAVRCVEDALPTDDCVFYGKIGYLGELIHESEVGE